MSEIIAIVNEFDEVVGSVEKSNFDKTTGQIYRTVSLFLFDKKGRILIQRRACGKQTYAGKWDLAAVAGHVTFGENYQECIQRETKEEIGLSGLEFFEADKEFTETAEGKRRFNQVFWAVEDFEIADLKLPEDEVAEVRLLKISELKKMFEESPDDFANYNNSDFSELAARMQSIAQKMIEKLTNS